MTKKETLKHWETLPDNEPILPHMETIPYKSKGSTYGACGIRIDGNPEFVDAVLGRLKDILAGENHITRLGLARNPVQTRLEIGGRTKVFTNSALRAEVCYIRLHERGSEGKIASVMLNRERDQHHPGLFDEE